MNRSIPIAALLASACAADPTDLAEPGTTAPARLEGPRLLQAGLVTLFAATDDDHAIYQLGQQVFAVGEGGAPAFIADVPAGNTAFVFPVGEVAFVWTNPDRTRPGFGVSPLYVWSAATGAHLASESSSIGTFATSANHEGDLIVFPADSPPSGATGDLVLASTDLSWRTTLASGVAMSFGSGPCQPRVVFRGNGDDVTGVTCTPGATSATFSTWRNGERTIAPEALSLPVRFRTDPQRGRAVSTLAGTRHPVVFDEESQAIVIAEATALNVFFGGDGAVLYVTQTPGQRPSVWRAKIGHAPEHVASITGINAIAFGSTGLGLPVTSPDGRYLSFADAVHPATGLPANVRLADLRGGDAPLALDATPGNVIFGQPFTADSAFALYARLDLASFAVGPMFAADADGSRQFGDERGWSWTPAFGSTITFNDRTDAGLVAADLHVVDLAREPLAPRLIAEQANVTYFTSRRGRDVVYTIDAGPDAGLYVAAVD